MARRARASIFFRALRNSQQLTMDLSAPRISYSMLANFVDQRVTMVGKVLLWISGFILSSIVVYQAIESTVAYIEGRHTFLSSSFDDQKNAKFPDLTICLRSPHGNMIPLKAQGIYHINLHAFAFCYSYDRGY